jgi:xylan 1,4-beta-xylosidase
MIVFTCDLSRPTRPFPHFWEHTIGSGHATLALRADYRKHLTRCRRELGIQHVRFHGLLSDDMGTLIESQGKKLYSFLNTDRIMDFLLEIGMKPLVELSFMPSCLAAGNQTVMHYHDIVDPPKDYVAWAALIEKLVSHWIDRYGIDEVRTWPFEVWNEPNIPAFWPADQATYFKLYETTVQAIKKVDEEIRVGGPVTAANAWIPEFRAFCAENDLPTDFISTHLYPTDALGTVDQDTTSQLADSKRDVMREKAEEARQQAGDLPLYYTEWSSSSNPHDPLHDEPYAAAFAARTILENAGLVEGYSWWTFSDIFDENYFPSMPYYGGFGLMNLYGVPKPTYRAYELLHDLGEELLPVMGSHPTVNVYAAPGPEDTLTFFVTNHERPRHPIRSETIRLQLSHCLHQPAGTSVRRIDEDHANPKRVWKEMGSPEYPSPEQVDLLEAASICAAEPIATTYADKKLQIELEIPPHGIAAITVHGVGGRA